MTDDFRDITRAEIEAQELAWQNRFLFGLMKNPDASVLAVACRKARDKELRGVAIGDDLYWWDAGLCAHSQGFMTIVGRAAYAAGARPDAEFELHEHSDLDLYFQWPGGDCGRMGRGKPVWPLLSNHPSIRDNIKDGCLVP